MEYVCVRKYRDWTHPQLMSRIGASTSREVIRSALPIASADDSFIASICRRKKARGAIVGDVRRVGLCPTPLSPCVPCAEENVRKVIVCRGQRTPVRKDLDPTAKKAWEPEDATRRHNTGSEGKHFL